PVRGRLTVRAHPQRGRPGGDRSDQQHHAHEQPAANDAAVAHICPLARRSANHFATFAFCSASVSANTWPPVPSATKYSAFVLAGCSTAAMLALPGLAIGPIGNPLIRYVL